MSPRFPRTLRRPAASLAAFGLLLLIGCGEPSAPSGDTSANLDSAAYALQGEVAIDGSSTVAPISRAVAGEFGEHFRRVKVTVGVSGTGGGFQRFAQGGLDIAGASRPIKRDEFESCQKNGVEFLELPVAYDGLTIVVNPENDWATQLTVDQLRLIYREDAAVKKWSELDPRWPAEEIHVYSPGHQSGTFDYFSEVMAKPGEKEVVLRKEMATNEDDNVLVMGVARDKYAIGYFGASYYFNNRHQVKAVSIINPQTGAAVAPTPEAIERGDYAPFSRPLFIYVNVNSLKRPEVKRFVSFYLANAQELARQVDYVGLSDDLQAPVRETYEARLTGTHYLTPDGEKRIGGLPAIYTEANRYDGQ